MARVREYTADELTALRELIACDPETGVFTNRTTRGPRARAGDVTGRKNSEGYIEITWLHVRAKAHRLVWYFAHGHLPEQDIDHINLDRTDNRIANLRLATRSENMQNRRSALKGSASGLLGVSWDSEHGKWRAQIMVGGKRRRLGYYTTAEQAHEAYVAAKRQCHPYQTIVPASAR